MTTQYNRSGKPIQPAGKPEQLKMFMSSREIEASWQPLDGDRAPYIETPRTRTEGTLPSSYRDKDDSQGQRMAQRRWYTPGGRDRAWSGDGGGMSMRKVQIESPESDDMLWDRKLYEAYDSDEHPVHAKRGNSYTMRSATTGGRPNQPMRTYSAEEYAQPRGAHFRHDETDSLGESIERTGVQKPIHLGRTVGSMGKPEIVGGHHRMAVMRNLNPDQLMPVLHHTDIHAARSKDMQKYLGGYS